MLANVSGVGEDAPVDFEAAGLLDGLEGSEREQREKLLTRLADDGFSLDDLTRAVQENRLALLPVDEVLGGAYSAEEIEERTDLPAGMAMFVSPEPAPLVKVALDLVAAFEREELPSLRAGIACGPALVRTGDYYGNSVNLASRVTGVTRPGSVLCTQEVHDAAADRFQWSTAGRFRLKGVAGQTRLFRARKPAASR